VTVPARVVWAVPAADGQCCIGARFEKRVAYVDLVSLTLP